MHRLVPVLAFLSGVCGIAYELLYFRIISAYLGDIFYVGAAVVTVFFLGIAFGSLYATDKYRYLPLAEFALGVYAIIVSFGLLHFGLSITTAVAQLPFSEMMNLLVAVFVILVPPAFLVGLTAPWFVFYVRNTNLFVNNFSIVYWLYNLGAAASVLLVEYVFIRSLGISASLLLVSVINFIVAGTLFRIKAPAKVSGEIVARNTVPQQAVLLLSALSFVSGILQMLVLYQVIRYVGPIAENFALFMVATLTSISVGTVLVSYGRISFATICLWIPAIIGVQFLLLPELIWLYSVLYTNGGVFLGKLCLIGLLVVPVFSWFGATAAALVEEHKIAHTGWVLAVTAGSNVCGFLGFLLVLHRPDVALSWIIFGCGVGIGLLVLFSRPYALNVLLVLALSVVLLVSVLVRWPSYLDSVAYHKVPETVMQGDVFSDETLLVEQQFGEDVRVVRSAVNNDVVRLQFNGYHSLTIGPGTNAVRNEAFVGIVGSHFTAATESALVLGLGAGFTTAAVVDRYDTVTVVEINPLMKKIVTYFSKENNSVSLAKNLTVLEQDGIVALANSAEQYDLVVNTVTTPAYFSANKLWTADVFDLIKQRLSPGGVFVGWLDSRLGDVGTNIMLDTLESVFAECSYAYINQEYFAFVCSDGPLTHQDRSWPADYFSGLLAEDWPGVSEILLLDSLMFDHVQPESSAKMINTLDHPVLSYLVLKQDLRSSTFSRTALVESFAAKDRSSSSQSILDQW